MLSIEMSAFINETPATVSQCIESRAHSRDAP